ncbi:MAG: hypothetical protein ABJ263_15595 [Tateyamaria sp.]|uniref:capsular polysaccharide export protein, LipB/KpsS family n=1 Tax=Tateyamaria sp. TaxID=1929288 RepID=UPI00326AB8B4
MAILLYTYTDWQAKIVPMLKVAVQEHGQEVFWIGRRSAGINSAMIRGVPRGNPFAKMTDFEGDGSLPTLDDPVSFERSFLAPYMYQMNRYAKGYGSRGHKMKYFHEYRDHFFLTARKFKRLLLEKEIKTVIFFNMPHTGDDFLLYRVAESIGIDTFMFMVSPFKDRFFSTKSIEAFGKLNGEFNRNSSVENEWEILTREAKDTVQSYMFGVRRNDDWKIREVFSAVAALLRRYPGFILEPKLIGKNVFEVMRLGRSLSKSRKTRREMLSGHRTKQLLDWLRGLERDATNLPEKFVYFPLHFQPELSTVPQGGIFGDQALAIEMLSAALPSDVSIAVKENPKQGAFHRESTFGARLKQLRNVVVLHPSMSNEILEDKCLGVAVVTGTAGWEAVRDRRPCICFGNAWYRDCPGVHEFHEGLDLQTVIDNPPTQDTNEAFLRKAMSRSHKGVVYEFYLKSDAPEFEQANFQALTDTFVKLAFGEELTTFQPG